MTREIEVDLSHLTAGRVRDIMCDLEKLDGRWYRQSVDDLPEEWDWVLGSRVLGQTLAEIAFDQSCTIEQVRHRQMQGLLALCRKFQELSGITVKVKTYRGQV